MPASYRRSLEHNTTFSANNANGKKRSRAYRTSPKHKLYAIGMVKKTPTPINEDVNTENRVRKMQSS